MSQQARSTSDGGFPCIRIGRTQILSSGGSSVASAAVGSNTTIFRIKCNQDVYVEVGQNPVATSASFPLDANYAEYFSIAPGEKIAVLQVSSGGTVVILEGA